MPRMNGWEFLEAFAELPKQEKETYVVTMLTTSTNEDDRNKASTCNTETDDINKPLTNDNFKLLMKKYFPGYFA